MKLAVLVQTCLLPLTLSANLRRGRSLLTKVFFPDARWSEDGKPSIDIALISRRKIWRNEAALSRSESISFEELFGENDFFDGEKNDIFFEEKEEIFEYTIEAFGKEHKLEFKRNSHLLPSAEFRVRFRHGEKDQELLHIPKPISSCHFLHKDTNSVAAISDCNDGRRVSGFVSTPQDTFEIAPLTKEQELLADILELRFPSLQGGTNEETGLYVVKRVGRPDFTEEHEHFEEEEALFGDRFQLEASTLNDESPDDLAVEEPAVSKTIELAVYLDNAAYNNLLDLSDSRESVVSDVLAAVNQVNAIYHHPSLGQTVNFAVVKMEVMEVPPVGLEHQDGERIRMLKAFCEYNTETNNPDDAAPDHWDLGLFLTGRDLWQKSRWGDERKYETLGLAPTGGICDKDASCVVAEFAAKPFDIGVKPYPSTGFGAAYILAHEIGHSLGMTHDGVRDSYECLREGYIMSSSRESGGETKWSSCSARKMRQQRAACLYDEPGLNRTVLHNHAEYQGLPGKFIDADRQCQRFLVDRNARAALYNPSLCATLKCKYTNGQPYEAGPALDGTKCSSEAVVNAANSEGFCLAGECTFLRAYSSEQAVWSEPVKGLCHSSCLKRSKGFREVSRFCLAGCNNNNATQSWHELCDDSIICREKDGKQRRKRHRDYASDKCRKETSAVRGSPAVYLEANPSQACQIFCQTTQPHGRWQPLVSSKVGKSETFPDGAWCHRQNETDYFCLEGECVPPPQGLLD